MTFPGLSERRFSLFQGPVQGPRLNPSVDRRRESNSDYLGLIVIDALCRVKFRFWGGSLSAQAKSLMLDEEGALLPEIRSRVASMIDQLVSGNSDERRTILLGEKHSVRLSPLFGTDEKAFGLIVEADRDQNSISRAAARFSLTKRQAQVLALVLEGAGAAEIARALTISEYTAQGYLKSLLSKTGSRNRAAMVAKVLNWNKDGESAARADEAAARDPEAVGVL